MISPNEYAPYYAPYISPLLTNGYTLLENLQRVQHDFRQTLLSLDEEKQVFRYAEGKWSIKELVQHIIDSERVFAYRAMCFARLDATPLPGFDENAYVANARSNERSWSSLLSEMDLVRSCTMALYESFTEEEGLRVGNASGVTMSVRAIGYCIAGHQHHHLGVIKERYL